MNYNATQSTAPKAPAPAMTYICAECGSDNEIKPKEPIRCKECGYRIMYKKRTKRSTSFSTLLFAPYSGFWWRRVRCWIWLFCLCQFWTSGGQKATAGLDKHDTFNGRRLWNYRAALVWFYYFLATDVLKTWNRSGPRLYHDIWTWYLLCVWSLFSSMRLQ